MQLQPGQNSPIVGGNPRLIINAPSLPGGIELDMTAFSLAANGKVLGDEGMVFYGATRSPDGSVELDIASRAFTLNLARVPAQIEKVAICLTLEKSGSPQAFSSLSSLSIDVQHGGETLSFAPNVGSMTEKALILVEVYRRGSDWKARALGQGFNGGLAPLATNYGVDVEGDSSAGAPASPTPPTPPPTPPTPPPTPPTPPSKPVDLSKITLEKKQPVNLTKGAGHGGFGKIICNLNWDPKGGNTGGGGFLQRMMGSAGAIDLDLACFFELGDGGKGVIQALGNSFGSYDSPPFCQLMGDDRSGSSSQGEFLHINGDHWALFRRVLVYAFIYEGAPSWDRAGAKVNITMPGQPPLEAVIDQHRDQGCCAIAMLENGGGQLSVTKLVEFFRDQQEMDQAYGFGFRWEAGRK
jgi:tellurite resistance protein TerA